MTNTLTKTFTVTFQDGYYRDHRVTFARASHGMFPTIMKLERLQDNGRDTFWTQYRISCHGEISHAVKQEIAKASELVRWQA